MSGPSVTISPWKPKQGQRYHACLPCASSFTDEDAVQARHPEWKPVRCPICGEGCWETELAREVKEKGVVGVCTCCAIKSHLNGA